MGHPGDRGACVQAVATRVGGIDHVRRLLGAVGCEPDRIALERPLAEADVFDRRRVHPERLQRLQLWGALVLGAVRERWPGVAVDWVAPLEVPKLLGLHTEGRQKFALYDWARRTHPELRLPAVEHRLKENGRDVVEVAADGGLVGYDMSDAVAMAHCAWVRDGWSKLLADRT